MANVFDIAEFILREQGPMTTWKLQKLVYYCQVWSLVWDDNPLFSEPIEAWANGPVVRKLYEIHRGQYIITDIPQGNPNNLIPEEVETIKAVLNYYGNKSSQYLSDLTHMEDPWQLARQGISGDRRSNQIISLESMAEYYESLSPDED